MTRRADLDKLTTLAALVLDERLQRLRQAAEARKRSMSQLAALNVAPVDLQLAVPVAERVGLTFERWADLRRAELNAVIARQTVDLMAEREAASLAFGRSQALRAVIDRQPPDTQRER